MRVRVHLPLFAAFLGVVAFLVGLMVLLVGGTLRAQLRGLHRAELSRELLLAADVLDAFPDLHPDSAAGLVSRSLGYRVTLIDRDGTVFGDSHVAREALPGVASHADRPEFLDALRGGVGFAERRSATVDERLLYAAMRTGPPEGPVVLRVAAPLADVEATVRRAQGAAAAAGLVAALAALALAYLLSRVFTRPLVALSERAGALAAGDFSRRVPHHSGVAELDDLEGAFNRLADELADRLAELGRQRDDMQALMDSMAEGVVALSGDARVLSINRAARRFLGVPPGAASAPVGTLIRQPELRQLLEDSVKGSVLARELNLGDRHFIVSSRLLEGGGSVTTFLDVSEIRRLEQVRRDFVANVSHELKTPLTSIRGFAETLLEDEPPEPLRRQFLELVRRNTLRLQRLVDDLLDLSRLESGGWRVEAEPVDLAAAAREAWESFEAHAAEKGVDFDVAGEAWALADEQGLTQIFQNLYDNALRYTPPGGSIRVEVRDDGRAATVAVTDTGSGIPARSLHRVFERFYRVDPARSREEGGTGLGLAIVRHLVLGMDGTVSAESELGRGTTIRFTLPPAPRAA